MKVSKNTILKYSVYTTVLTKAVKNADRLHVQRIDNDVYVCNGFFAVRLNLSEYDALIRPVTQRDAGDYVMEDGEAEDGAHPIDIADILAKSGCREVNPLKLTPFRLCADQSQKKCNEEVVTYYSESGFVCGIDSRYDAIIKGAVADSPWLTRNSQKSGAPILFYQLYGDEPYAMILPVRLKAEMADTIRSYYKPQQDEREKLERLEAEKWELERENEESKRVIAQLRKELKESRECIFTLGKQVRAADTSRENG